MRSDGAIAVHVTAAAFWAGALPRLRAVFRSGRLEHPDVLSRFSAAILVSIAILLSAGVYLASIQLGSVEVLWATRCGNLLQVKVALVVAALAVTAACQFTPPPRSLDLHLPVLSAVHISDATAMATISFETKPDLSFDAVVFLQTADFDALDPKEVTLEMSAADGSVAAFDVPVEQVSSGLWRAVRGRARCDCDWHIRVEALVSDSDLVSLKGDVRLLSEEERTEAVK